MMKSAPIFEHYEVIQPFGRITTRCITKEMYDLYDKETVISRFVQEGTAPVVRSYVENKLFALRNLQRPSKFLLHRPNVSAMNVLKQVVASIPPN